MNDSLLLEAPLPMLRTPSGLRLESQAVNGLRLWLQSFGRVTFAAPVIDDPAQADANWTWVDPMAGVGGGDLRLVPLPQAYRPDQHWRRRGSMKRLFAQLIDEHRYLLLCNIGGAGAWGSLAARIAREKGRPYATGLDWVLHEMPMPPTSNPLRRLKASLERAWLRHGSLDTVRHAELLMAHGATVLHGYAPHARRIELIHDIHVGPEQLIGSEALAAKLARSPSPFRIAYVGRVHPMKGPLDWIEVMRSVARQVPADRPFLATWIGDGPLLDECRAKVRALGLEGVVRFAGVERDRKVVLESLRASDLFVFCHLTPESPRCLIESLMCGTPLAGYTSEYAAELTARDGGALLTPLGDVEALAQAVLGLMAAPDDARRSLVAAAAASGRQFTDEAVFRHRSELLRKYLP